MRIFLADPYITGYSGHCYAYMFSLRQAFESIGHECAIVGAKAIAPSFITETGVISNFSAYSSEPPWFPSRLTKTFVKDLQALQARFTLDADCLLVINSLRYFHLEGLAQWLGSLPDHQRPTIALILHYTSMGPRRVMKRDFNGYSAGFAALARFASKGRLQVLADTSALIDELQPISPMPIDLAPIPPGLPTLPQAGQKPAERTPDRAGNRASKRFKRIAFAGEARWGKGFHLLLAAAAELSPDIADGDVEFVVQTHNAKAETRGFRRVINALARYDVKTITSPLSPQQYAAFIASADILLLPYLAHEYRTQSSGVFVEALVSAKVVVAPADTWMGQQIQANGGGVVFAGKTPAAFQSAVRDAITRFEDLQEAALKNASRANAFHSADHFAGQLISGSVSGTQGR